MLTIEQVFHKTTGEPLKAFFVRNKTGKAIALGAQGCFVIMCAKRYANDKDIVAKVEKLTGIRPRNT